MARINLGHGKWFETDSAACWKEDTRWDGNNRISVATGSQWDHEELYHTRSGAWILHEWQCSHESYSVINAVSARVWLIDQDHAAAVESLFPGALAAAEV